MSWFDDAFAFVSVAWTFARRPELHSLHFFQLLGCEQPQPVIMKNVLALVLLLLLGACYTTTVVVDAWKGTKCEPPCVLGSALIMRQKEHGTSHTTVQTKLRWKCDSDIAERICNFNRQYAEPSGYWEDRSTFLAEESDIHGNTTTNTTVVTPFVTFYDSNTGVPLFAAPVGRSWKDFVTETRREGWPSFRDNEVNWKYVRVLPNGETVSTAGTHLGHNLPDKYGNRYCVNLVCIAGNPEEHAE